MKALAILASALFVLSASARPNTDVVIKDIQAKRFEMSTNAILHEHCVFGKNEQNVNFIFCGQMIGDLSKGVYRMVTPPLKLSIPGLSFQLKVDPAGFSQGQLHYVFTETDLENPQAKPSEEFYDQVSEIINQHGPAELELLYIGDDFDPSLFGTPVRFR